MLQLRVSEKSSNEEAQVHMRSCESLSVKVVFFHNGPAQTTRVKRQIWSSAATASVAAAEIKGWWKDRTWDMLCAPAEDDRAADWEGRLSTVPLSKEVTLSPRRTVTFRMAPNHGTLRVVRVSCWLVDGGRLRADSVNTGASRDGKGACHLLSALCQCSEWIECCYHRHAEWVILASCGTGRFCSHSNTRAPLPALARKGTRKGTFHRQPSSAVQAGIGRRTLPLVTIFTG